VTLPSTTCRLRATDVDHIVPKVHGGTDDTSNLQSLCAAHHRLKTATVDRRWGPPEGRGVTVILVTHLMEEAERLADRVAVIRDGRLIALDTPSGIVSLVEPVQRLHFRPSAAVDDRLLTQLPEVRSVERAGPVVTVSGTGAFVQAVAAALARQQIIAHDLRIDRPDLDDAFLALTRRS